MKRIDAEKLKSEVKNLNLATKTYEEQVAFNNALAMVVEIIDSLQQQQPEPYFYCKYGGIMSLCSDCKRNHNNSSFKTEEITTWYAPSNGTKQCIDYIQQEQSVVDLEKEIKRYQEHYILLKEKGFSLDWMDIETTARHFYERGLSARKEEKFDNGVVQYDELKDRKYVLVPYEEFQQGDKVIVQIRKKEE